MELVFEAAKRVLSIRVKYSRVMADDAMVGHLLKLMPQPSSNVASNIRRRIIKVGTNFLLNGSLVVVISSDLDNVVVRHADSGIEETINSSNARVLIRQFIGF